MAVVITALLASFWLAASGLFLITISMSSQRLSRSFFRKVVSTTLFLLAAVLQAEFGVF